MVIAISFVVLAGGVVELTRLIARDRVIEAAEGMPRPRGASTTAAGMAIGAGLAGVFGGAAALLPGSRPRGTDEASRN